MKTYEQLLAEIDALIAKNQDLMRRIAEAGDRIDELENQVRELEGESEPSFYEELERDYTFEQSFPKY